MMQLEKWNILFQILDRILLFKNRTMMKCLVSVKFKIKSKEKRIKN